MGMVGNTNKPTSWRINVTLSDFTSAPLMCTTSTYLGPFAETHASRTSIPLCRSPCRCTAVNFLCCLSCSRCLRFCRTSWCPDRCTYLLKKEKASKRGIQSVSSACSLTALWAKLNWGKGPALSFGHWFPKDTHWQPGTVKYHWSILVAENFKKPQLHFSIRITYDLYPMFAFAKLYEIQQYIPYSPDEDSRLSVPKARPLSKRFLFVSTHM